MIIDPDAGSYYDADDGGVRLRRPRRYTPAEWDSNGTRLGDSPLFDLVSGGTARCKSDPDLMFLPKAGRQQREMCRSCPLLTPCRQYALANDVKGFWGGLSEGERQQRRGWQVAG